MPIIELTLHTEDQFCLVEMDVSSLDSLIATIKNALSEATIANSSN